MNSFGRIFRLSVFGESHGPMIGVVMDGVMPGLTISADDFSEDLQRRRGGVQPGTTSRQEPDVPNFLSGVFNGKTTGAPLTIAFENTDTKSKDYELQKNIPRPGHADFTAAMKFKGFQDYRGSGHFSGRLTALLVAAGVVAKKMIGHHHPQLLISSKILSLGGNENAEEAIALAIKNQDSIGGVIQCRLQHVPIGLGEPFFDSFESVVSHLVFSIPAVKAIEFGAGFAAAKMKGSEHNDALMNANGITETNHAGGINGGISNGNEIVFRIAVKPTSSTPQQQTSYNFTSGKSEEFQVKGRHDLCIALRVPVVLEAVAAIALTDLLLLNR